MAENQARKGRQGKAERQARKATNAGKKRQKKGRQEKLQRKTRNGTKAGKERYKGGRKHTRQARQARYKSRQGKPKFKIKIINPVTLYRRG